MGSDTSGRIDLHVHSTASDGTLTPAELLDLARQLNIGAFAITDHDTLDGVREFPALPAQSPIDVLSGVEISAAPPPTCPKKGSFHILGYGIDVNDAALNAALARLQNARRQRNPQIIARLRALGFDVTLEEVGRAAGGDRQMGRPHIARLMVQKGCVASIDDAFDQFLGYGKPAYVDKYRIDCADSIRLIAAAGGIPVLAHPGITLAPTVDADTVLAELRAMGLAGIEAYYPEHTPGQTTFYEAVARRHGLLMTGGTDFHGAMTPGIQMGFGGGNFHVPYTLYRELVDALDERRAG